MHDILECKSLDLCSALLLALLFDSTAEVSHLPCNCFLMGKDLSNNIEAFTVALLLTATVVIKAGQSLYILLGISSLVKRN